MAPSELGAYLTITGSGVLTQKAHGRGRSPPHKKYTLQLSHVKSWDWKINVWTRTPPWTQRKKCLFTLYQRILKNSFERFVFLVQTYFCQSYNQNCAQIQEAVVKKKDSPTESTEYTKKSNHIFISSTFSQRFLQNVLKVFHFDEKLNIGDLPLKYIPTYSRLR